MEYSIRDLSELAGVSARTLRHYDAIGLLKPSRTSDSGYRYYDSAKVDLLQQILFFKERGLGLKQIADILYTEDFNPLHTLREHLTDLELQRARLDLLIHTVKNTITSMRGECSMNDREKFEAFKQNMVYENEAAYGKEVREKYGDEAAEAANRKLLRMNEEEYHKFRKLEEDLLLLLEDAVSSNKAPEDKAGQKAAFLHQDWLKMTWNSYNTESHGGVVQMYTADERFTAYYDRNVPGCAEFLKSAVIHWIV